jgi:hypothetical protein
MNDLSNITVLITGASSGIGEHTAYEAAKKGAHLILCARRTERLEQVKETCESLGAADVKVYTLDIINPDDTDDLITYLQKEKIVVNVLINNAGMGHSEPFIEMDFPKVLELFKVNVLGLIYLTQQIAIQMLDNYGGQIINVASLAGKVTTPNYSIYGATKGAIINFSNALRMELKPFDIHVTTVNFGPVDTPFFDHIANERKEKSVNSPFILEVEEAAQVVVNTIGKRKREVNRPLLLSMGAKFYQLFPAIGDYILTSYFKN